jgi:hypothetical protein
VLEDGAALAEREGPEIAAVDVEAVERPEHRRRRDLVRLGVAEEPHVADELLVERRDLAIEDEPLGAQRGDGGRDLRKSARVIGVGAAHEPDAWARLGRDDPPAVDLFLVQPTRTVKRLGEGRGHEPPAAGGGAAALRRGHRPERPAAGDPGGAARP